MTFRIYCAGGFIGEYIGGFIGEFIGGSTAEYYCPENDIWTRIQPMGSPRSGLSIISYNGDVFAVGGCDRTSQLKTAEVRIKRL